MQSIFSSPLGNNIFHPKNKLLIYFSVSYLICLHLLENKGIMNNNDDKIRKFTDLYAWQEGHKLVLMVYKNTENFPDKERFGIIDQMRRASVSVTSNIAEGFSRRSPKEKNRFYCVAQASLVELQNQLIISRDIGYLSNDEFKIMANQSIVANKLSNGLLKATKDKKFES